MNTNTRKYISVAVFAAAIILVIISFIKQYAVSGRINVSTLIIGIVIIAFAAFRTVQMLKAPSQCDDKKEDVKDKE
ncbi:MAG: hypothetical protein Q8903_04975 [Bacteroidota bacterium]|nr:hypothetical protein [Bacteroidota bacterium]